MAHQTAGPGVLAALTAVKVLLLLLGGVVTFYAARAYRRTNDRSLGLLAVGFGLVTLGAALGGLTFEVTGAPLATGVLVESVFVLGGFALIAQSLRVR